MVYPCLSFELTASPRQGRGSTWGRGGKDLLCGRTGLREGRERERGWLILDPVSSCSQLSDLGKEWVKVGAVCHNLSFVETWQITSKYFFPTLFLSWTFVIPHPWFVCFILCQYTRCLPLPQHYLLLLSQKSAQNSFCTWCPSKRNTLIHHTFIFHPSECVQIF